ncbi:hypothetical protein M2347_000642 [Chryseobacterium sp. H1D6B]|uniref:hypothetical protein n=1 Tax=Chryseobacterium sp. H1D6B TaxID=2940588 RepID=UPI0015CBC328|nr:hypothetical protein [Chryseobacterium sp. H1D6B]MDH6250915.1 hypothetical protein [Chryseobacterium sp. H1D6B]
MTNIVLINKKNDSVKLSEEELIGKTIQEIDEILSIYEKEKISYEEYIVVLKSMYFGLFKTRLYLYFTKGLVRDYYIGM